MVAAVLWVEGPSEFGGGEGEVCGVVVLWRVCDCFCCCCCVLSCCGV